MRYDIVPYDLKLVDPFGISRNTRTHSPTILLHLDEGWGEASPYKLYGETPETLTRDLKVLESFSSWDFYQYRSLLSEITGLIPKAYSARTSIDLATWDLLGKSLDAPVYKILGISPDNAPLSSFTIGIDTLEVMLEKTRKAQNYPILKVKVGFDGDMEMLQAIREIYSGKIRVDANAAWTWEQAREKIARMKELDIEFVEQPLDRYDFEGQEKLHKAAKIPIILDESILTAKDILSWHKICNGINIKLMKCGGILHALTMIELARLYDLEIMLGCMLETSVGISAAAQLAPLVDYIDLDGNILISNDPFQGCAINNRGQMKYSERPGLGVVPGDDFQRHINTATRQD